jgi:hypothetical protein
MSEMYERRARKKKQRRNEGQKAGDEDEGCRQALYLGHWTTAPAEVSATLENWTSLT